MNDMVIGITQGDAETSPLYLFDNAAKELGIKILQITPDIVDVIEPEEMDFIIHRSRRNCFFKYRKVPCFYTAWSKIKTFEDLSEELGLPFVEKNSYGSQGYFV